MQCIKLLLLLPFFCWKIVTITCLEKIIITPCIVFFCTNSFNTFVWHYILHHSVSLDVWNSVDSFNLLINNGAAAGQVIFHTHMHIIPRKAFDCLWTSESLLRRPLNLNDEKVSQLAACIQEQLMVSDICEESKNADFCSSKS